MRIKFMNENYVGDPAPYVSLLGLDSHLAKDKIYHIKGFVLVLTDYTGVLEIYKKNKFIRTINVTKRRKKEDRVYVFDITNILLKYCELEDLVG